MKEDYQKALEVIFAYGYRCCMFKHNICGSQPKVPNDIPDSSNQLPSEFFANPRCPLVLVVTEMTAAEEDLIESVKDYEDKASVGD